MKASVRTPHHLKQRAVFSQIHASLRDEPERILMTLRPFDQFRQEFLDVALVADKVVVNDENLAAPAHSLSASPDGNADRPSIRRTS